MNPPILDILSRFGITDLRDRTTIFPLDSFEKLDAKLVCDTAEKYHIAIPDNPDAELRFNAVNYILQQKHGLIIDNIKELDGIAQEGFRLEIMPC